MSEADCYRALARAHDDLAMHRTLLALLPWTVHVDHEYERSVARATRLLNRLPAKRTA